MNNKYELICLVSAKIDEIERDTIIENISKLIKEKGGEITKMAPSSEVSLGYTIKKENKAQIVVFKFEYTNPNLIELKKEIESDKRIIRCFLRKELIKKIIPSSRRTTKKSEKVDLKDIDKKIEEIFNSASVPSSTEKKSSDQVSEINIKKDESK